MKQPLNKFSKNLIFEEIFDEIRGRTVEFSASIAKEFLETFLETSQGINPEVISE